MEHRKRTEGWTDGGARDEPTLNYSKILRARESLADLLSLSEHGGVISVKITLWSPFYCPVSLGAIPFSTFFHASPVAVPSSSFPILPPRPRRGPPPVEPFATRINAVTLSL